MESTDRNTVADQTRSRLESACAHATEGDYSSALSIVRSLKAEAPGNIYVVALERQIQSLVDLAVGADADPGQQQIILETFPNLVERAADEAARSADSEDLRKTAAARPPAAEGPAPAAPRAPELQRLVEEFFKQAESCIKRGDLENASREINRVFIIDPGNAKAKAYEHTIARLVAARVRPAAPKPAPAPAARPAPAPLPKPDRPSPPTPAAQATVEFVPVPQPRESVAPAPEPAVPALVIDLPAAERMPDAQAVQPKARARTRRSTNLRVYLPFAAVLLLGVAALVAYALFSAGAEDRGAATSAALPPPAQTKVDPPPAATSQEELAAEPEFTPIPGTKTPVDAAPTERPSVAAAPPTEPARPSRESARSGDTGTERRKKEGKERKDSAQRQSDVPPPKIEVVRPATLAAGAAVTTPPQPVLPSQPKSEAPPPTPAEKPAAEAAQPAAATPTPFTEVMKEPQVVQLQKPRVDATLLSGSVTGEVVVRVQIDIDGKPLAAKIVRSTNAQLNDAVIDAVMRSTYLPAQMASGPVRSWIAIPFRFK